MSASAVVVHLPGDKALSYQPLRGSTAHLGAALRFDQMFGNLEYNGGPVMPSNTNYTFYWAPSGAPKYPTGYQTGVNRYLEDLAHDSGGHENVDSVSAQYNDSAGEFASYSSTFAGAIVDTDPYPTNGCTRAPICLTDAQIQTEIHSYVTAHGLPEGLSTEYFLLTPPEVEDCFTASGSECSAGSTKPVYCAYHGNIPVGGTQIIYSNDPYVTGNLGCDDGNHPNGKSDGVLEGGLSHEHNESITDPEPNNAWTDFGSPEAEQGEIGDKCGNEMGASLGEAPVSKAAYNQVINGHLYWYQEEWSNQQAGCLQRLEFSGARPTAKITATLEGVKTVRFVGTGSTAPGGVSAYSWQFNESAGEPSKPVERSSATTLPAHTFAASGSHVVALTVFSPNGTSIGTAKTIVLGDAPPTAAFTSSGSTPGTPVSFDATSSTSSNGGVSSYEWQFGDGASATGASTAHVYAAAGSYEATLSVTDASGFTSTATHTVVVGGEGGGAGSGTGGGGGGTGGGVTPVVPITVSSPTVTPPAAIAPILSPSPAPVQGSAQLLRIKRNRDGSADLFIRVSAPGLLSAAEVRPARSRLRRARLRSTGTRAAAAGIVRIHIALARAGLRAISATSHLTLTVSLTFTPAAPLLAATPLHVTLRLSRRRH